MTQGRRVRLAREDHGATPRRTSAFIRRGLGAAMEFGAEEQYDQTCASGRSF